MKNPLDKISKKLNRRFVYLEIMSYFHKNSRNWFQNAWKRDPVVTSLVDERIKYMDTLYPGYAELSRKTFPR